MSGFSFPPPPPPPPKSAQPQQYSQNLGQARGRGSFRGGREQRGRGRGRLESFSPGHNNSNTFQRPPLDQRGNSQNGHNQNNFNTVANQRWSSLQQTQPGLQSQALLPGAFINPNFAGPEANSNVNQYNAHLPNRNPALQLPEAQHGQRDHQEQSPPRTAAGHKRKLEALRGPAREKKPAPPTAPSVPGFGAAIVPPKPTLAASASQGDGRSPSKPKSTGRSLGLIPGLGDAQNSPSDSENDEREVDEEATYAELGDKLTFEHNGVLMSLTSQADLAAWKKERQKNWPTRERMAEKERERQRIGEERKRLLASAHSVRRSSRRTDPRPNGKRKGSLSAESSNVANTEGSSLQNSTSREKPETELEKAKREVAERTKLLEDLRRKVAESETRNREARARKELNADNSTGAEARAEDLDDQKTTSSVDGVPGIKQETQPDDAGEEASENSEDSPLESSSVVSADSLSESESEDEPPEETASKPLTAAIASTETRVCKYFAASGYCRDGDACRFRHERRPEQLNSPVQHPQGLQKPQRRVKRSQHATDERDVQRKGIFERLMEQEQVEEDKLALKVIKYLGSAGFFKEAAPEEGE